MLHLAALFAAVVLSGSAAAQCHRWVPAHGHDLTTTALAVSAAGSPGSILARLRGATLPRCDGGCRRETLFAQLARAKILVETAHAVDLPFRLPEADGDAVVATIFVDGRDLAAVLAEKGLAGRSAGAVVRADPRRSLNSDPGTGVPHREAGKPWLWR